jgi:hypothetical protein
MNAFRYLCLAMIAVVLCGAIPMILAADKPATQPAAAGAADMTGTWKWSVEFGGNSVDFSLKLKQEGNKLTGTLSGFNGQDSPIEDGTVAADGTFSFKIKRDFNGRTSITTYSGKRAGESLKGKSETTFVSEFDAKRSEN